MRLASIVRAGDNCSGGGGGSPTGHDGCKADEQRDGRGCCWWWSVLVNAPKWDFQWSDWRRAANSWEPKSHSALSIITGFPDCDLRSMAPVEELPSPAKVCTQPALALSWALLALLSLTQCRRKNSATITLTMHSNTTTPLKIPSVGVRKELFDRGSVYNEKTHTSKNRQIESSVWSVGGTVFVFNAG